jgi:protein Mpv17
VGWLRFAGLEKLCRRLVPGGGARFLATKVVLDSAVMGSVYVAAFFAFGSVVLEGNGLQGFLQKMKVRWMASLMLQWVLWMPTATWHRKLVRTAASCKRHTISCLLRHDR